MKKWPLPLFAAILSCTFFACSDDKLESNPLPPAPDPTPKIEISGYAEMGAFEHGSSIVFTLLDDQLKPKKSENKATIANMGFYKIDTDLLSTFTEVQVSGYFFNPVRNERSTHSVTLRAFNHYSYLLPTHINILTQLTAGRVTELLKSNPDFAAAKNKKELFEVAQVQASKELADAFSIQKKLDHPAHICLIELNEYSAIQAVITSSILEAVDEELLNDFFKEWDKDFIPDGHIDSPDIKERIAYGLHSNPSLKVQKNLSAFYSATGNAVEFPALWKYIDRNGDGVINENDKPTDVTPPSEVAKPSEEECMLLIKQANKYLCNYLQNETVWEANFCGIIESIAGYPTTMTSITPTTYQLWTDAYKTIAQCNQMIYLLTTQEYSFDSKPYVGSLYAVQSFLYLSLAQLYGSLPYMTPLNFKESGPPRSTVNVIYAGQTKALEEYSSYLPKTATGQNVNYASAQLIMCLMAMEMNDFSTAAKHLAEAGAGEPNSALWRVENDMQNYANNYYPSSISKDTHHVVFRSELINLLKAEIHLKTNSIAEASAALKLIKSSWPGSSNADEVKACLLELAKEYMGKNYGYFALLKRMGVAKEKLKLEDFQLLLPIPSNEMIVNMNMTQNPGYH